MNPERIFEKQIIFVCSVSSQHFFGHVGMGLPDQSRGYKQTIKIMNNQYFD